MPRVVRSRPAALDLIGIIAHIAQDNVSAARKWRQTMARVFQLLARHPYSGEAMRSNRYGAVRRHAHGNYVIYFRPLDDGIEVLRVFHGAQQHERHME